MKASAYIHTTQTAPSCSPFVPKGEEIGCLAAAMRTTTPFRGMGGAKRTRA